MNSTRRYFPIYLLLLLMAGSAAAQIRTVLVSPVPGDPVASGTALRNALAGIASPSSTNRWLVKIEPGTFDIGTTALPMRSWVDMEGSGIGATTIKGSVAGVELITGTINGASNTELRLLTVTNTITGVGPCIALYNESVTAMRIYRVKFTSTGGTGAAWGIRNFASAPLIEECEFSVTAGGSAAYGLVYSWIAAEKSSILRSKIAVWGATNNYGVYMSQSQTVTVLRDSRIDVTGGQNTYGLYAVADPGWHNTDSLTIRDTEISSAGGGTSSYGLRFGTGTSIVLDIASSKIWGHVAPTTYGVSQYGNAPLGIQGSSIVGFTGTVESLNNASIASTGLTGGPVSVAGWVGCMGVWDENGVFYAQSCP